MKGFGIGRDDPAFHLLTKMLTIDPKKRVNSDEVMCHKYFTDAPNPTDDVFSCFSQIPFPHRKYLSKKIEAPKLQHKARITRKTHLQEINI